MSGGYSGNGLGEQATRQRDYIRHRERVAAQKSRIDNSTPASCAFSRSNRDGTGSAHATTTSYRKQKIESDNEKLVERMVHIMQTGGRVDNKEPWRDPSRAAKDSQRRRQVEQQRIARENAQLLERLEHAQPTYSSRRFEADSTRNAEIGARISRYPRQRPADYDGTYTSSRAGKASATAGSDDTLVFAATNVIGALPTALPTTAADASVTENSAFLDDEVSNSDTIAPMFSAVKAQPICELICDDVHSDYPGQMAGADAAAAASAKRDQKCGFVAAVKDAMELLIPYGGLMSNVFSLGSVTLGGGIISIASSFATSGIAMAIIYLVVINIITIYTITIMGYAIKETGYKNYEEMARGLFGRGWDYFVGFIVWLSSIGTAIAYISAVSSLLTPIIEKAPHTPVYLKTASGNRLLTSMVWLGLMVPVVIPKRVNSVRYVSAFGVIMVLYFVVVIVVHSCTNGLKLGMRDDMRYFTTGNEAIYGLSIFIFAFLSQCITYPVYLEQRPTPSIRQLTLAAAISMTGCMIFYILAGVFGYFDFAGKTKSSILYNFDPVHQPYMMVAYIGLLIKICAAYAMNMLPCRDYVYYCLNWEVETTPYWKHIIVVVTLSLAILLCGLFIPSINLAFGLVGSLCGGFIGFIFPVLFWMYCGHWSLRIVGVWHYFACHLVLIGGVIAIVFGTIATIVSSFIYV